MARQKSVGEESELVRGSIAGRSLNRKPSFLRFVRNEPTLKLLTVVFAVLVAIFIGAMALGDALANPGEDPGMASKAFKGVGCVVFLLAAGIGWLIHTIWKALQTSFANGLLSAGMIVDLEPLTVAVLANVGTGADEGPNWGLVLERVNSLPGHELKKGERVPCVCTFRPGADDDVWGDISPTPVCHGLGGQPLLDEARRAIGDDEFERIRALAKQKIWPKTVEQLVILRADSTQPEVVERAGVTERKAREADRQAKTE